MLQTIGSDMEVFGQTKDGHHVALCGLIGGTKEKPKPIEGFPEGFMIQEDNVALEFNIPICTNANQFVNSFAKMREYCSNLLKSLNLELSPNASMSFDKKELFHPNALVFGCEPDYDAWSKKENKKPYSKNKELRTCGGHVHVGSEMDMVQGVRNMDLFLGVPSVLLDNSEASKNRRQLYGKAGAMRPKPYGWEYRTLSNFWMFSDDLVNWVYQQTKLACSSTVLLSAKEGKRIVNCINTGNVDEAKALIQEYNIPCPTKYVEKKNRADVVKTSYIKDNFFHNLDFIINTPPTINWLVPDEAPNTPHF